LLRRFDATRRPIAGRQPGGSGACRTVLLPVPRAPGADPDGDDVHAGAALHPKHGPEPDKHRVILSLSHASKNRARSAPARVRLLRRPSAFVPAVLALRRYRMVVIQFARLEELVAEE